MTNHIESWDFGFRIFLVYHAPQFEPESNRVNSRLRNTPRLNPSLQILVPPVSVISMKANLSTSAKVIWLTGPPSSGKTTLAVALVQELLKMGLAVEHLDGDAIRSLFPKTGFDRESRNEHISRVGHLASRLEHHGVWVVVSLVSPYSESRNFTRNLCQNFIEVYLSTPLSICQQRDVKGLYRMYREGKIKNLTGADGDYEIPHRAEYVFDTSIQSVEECIAQIKTGLPTRPVHQGNVKVSETII